MLRRRAGKPPSQNLEFDKFWDGSQEPSSCSERRSICGEQWTLGDSIWSGSHLLNGWEQKVNLPHSRRCQVFQHLQYHVATDGVAHEVYRGFSSTPLSPVEKQACGRFGLPERTSPWCLLGHPVTAATCGHQESGRRER